MKKIIVLLVVLCLFCCSDTDSNLENRILTGSFKELSPVENRVTVEVTTQNLSYIRDGADSGISFTIKLLSANLLELSCNQCDETAPQVVPYNIIDSNTFEIGSFFLTTETDIITLKRI